MIHLKIYEDYFGDENYVNKKDLKFLDDLLSIVDLNLETWSYQEANEDGRFTQQFKKIFSFNYNSGERTSYYDKHLKIKKTSQEPKNILDRVKQPFYQIKYDDNILDISQERAKDIFDQLMQEQELDNIKHAKTRKGYAEKERDEDVRKLVKKKVKKYNL